MLVSSLLLTLFGLTACSPIVRSEGNDQPYLAPLEGTEHEEAFRNEYLVVFDSDYTLEQHFDTIGRNLTSLARFKRFSYGYRANLDDQTRDEQVRCDPGVRPIDR